MLSTIDILNSFHDEIPDIVPKQIDKITRELQPLKLHILEIQQQNIDQPTKDIQSQWAVMLSGMQHKIDHLEKLKKIYKMYTIRTKNKDSYKFDDKLELARKYPIKDMYSFENLKLKGNKYFASCPFHTDKTPSFVIYPNNRYHCFSCQSNGSNIDFFMKLHNLSFKDAIVKLS